MKPDQAGDKAAPSEVRPLSVPIPVAVVFPENFLATAVCELRYPTLLEIETRSPTEIQKSLRKAYPNYERKRRVIAVRQGKVESEAVHEFRTRSGSWVVSLRPSAFAIETSDYTKFEDFEERLSQAFKVLAPEIDSPFFTRIGLRYINQIPAPESGGIEGVVNPTLIAGLDVFGTVSSYSHEVGGWADGNARYTFRYGFADEGQFNLDLDFYQEDVEVQDALATVRKLHASAYALFSWSLGPKGQSLMGVPTLKK